MNHGYKGCVLAPLPGLPLRFDERWGKRIYTSRVGFRREHDVHRPKLDFYTNGESDKSDLCLLKSQYVVSIGGATALLFTDD
jgi:hypothetical protein